MKLLLFLLLANLVSAITPTVGAKITFYATADGTEPMSWQWYKNGVPIPNATGPTWVILSATLADSGTYRVKASNIAGSADSADEVLVIEPATPPPARPKAPYNPKVQAVKAQP
jgi:hypothetical protein